MLKVWTEEMKLFALHITYSTKFWFIHSFPDPIPCLKGREVTFLYSYLNTCLESKSVLSRQTHLHCKLIPVSLSRSITSTGSFASFSDWNEIVNQSSCVMQPFIKDKLLSLSIYKIHICLQYGKFARMNNKTIITISYCTYTLLAIYIQGVP